MKSIEIFRAGTHVAANGKEYTFSQEQVAQIAAAYEPAVFSAPAVVGHPKTEDPAYGWASELTINDAGVLVADLDKVQPEFAEAVEAGRWPKVSVSLYGPTDKGNPKPGGYYLRHIGFLGGAAPGVKGLTPIAFADGEECLDFTQELNERKLWDNVRWLASNLARMVRRQREQLIADHGVEEADRILPSWDADAPAEIAAAIGSELDATRPEPRFNEGDPTDTQLRERLESLTAREASITQREEAQAARDTEFAEGQAQTRRSEDLAFAEGLVAAGKLPPGYADVIVGVLETLDGGDAISFSEGAEPVDPRVGFRDFLTASLGTVIRFDEVAGGEGARFAEGQSADELASQARQRVADAAARGETISVSAAMTAITAGR